MALARRLRRIAQEHPRDPVYNRLRTAAAEIEERTLSLAAGETPSQERDRALHAPINLVI
jgi:hypothetical protein